MINFIQFFEYLHSILSSKYFFLFTEIIAFIVVTTMSFLLIKSYIQHNKLAHKHNHAFYFLLLISISMAIENFAWIFKLCHQLEYININYLYVQILVITAWPFNLILYQSLGLFIENIIENKFTFRWHQKLFFIINAILSIIFIYSGISHIYNLSSHISINTMFRITSIYRTFTVIPSIMIAFQKIYYTNIPAILKKQLTLFLKYIIFPFLLSELIQCIPFYSPQGAVADISGLIASICVAFMTAVIIFCARNLIQFRLLNFSNKVQDKSNTSLTGSFKDSIESLSLATIPQELTFISQRFFKENFQTAIENVCLNFRYQQEICSSNIDNYCNLTSNTI